MKKTWLSFGLICLAALLLAGCDTVHVVLSSEPGQAAELIGAGAYTQGQEATVSAMPEPGWEFVSWTQGGQVVSETSDFTFVVRRKTKLTANLRPLEYAVSALAQGQGDFLYSQEPARHGSEYTITAVPERGYRFVCWTEQGEVVSTEAEYTFTAAGHRDLTAMFLPEDYKVDLEIEEGGQVAETWTLLPAAQVTLEAIPREGYEFFGWVDLQTQQEVATQEEYSFICEERRSILARFRKELVPADGSSLKAVVGKQTTIGEYAPADLVELPSHLSVKKRRVRSQVADALEIMAQAAQAEGAKLNVDSGYRSYSTQHNLFYRYAKRDGVLAAERYSARPGQSEHQLGTAVDFGGTNRDYSDGFADTSQGKWLLANAYKFGFALSYPRGSEEITGYKYEPWHYRYIGVELALEWKESGLTLIEFLQMKNQAD
jgi:D-alanyl-D-alanine carboxypeptidase